MSEKQRWNAAKCASESQEIEELQAAINLTPEEIGSLSDAVLLSSLDRVLPRCPHLPCHVVHSLVRRATEIAIQGRRPYEVVEIARPWGEAHELGFNARTPRLRDATSGHGVAISQAAPSEETIFWTLGAGLLIAEYLAKLMMAKADRSAEIVALAQAIAKDPPPLAEGEHATKYEEILFTTLGVLRLWCRLLDARPSRFVPCAGSLRHLTKAPRRARATPVSPSQSFSMTRGGLKKFDVFGR